MLDAREVALVKSLIGESSLKGAASHLGMSERHARRLVANLIERLGVGNRYHLVAITVQAGVVEVPSLPLEDHQHHPG